MNSLNVKNYIQCNSCKMFCHFTPQEYSEVAPFITKDTICSNCHDIFTLKTHIDHLNKTIFDLHDRIANLSKIRSLEDDIDDLSAKFRNFDINDQNGIELQEVVVTSNGHTCNSLNNDCNVSSQTSVWSESTGTNKSTDFPLDLSSKHTIIDIDTGSDDQNDTTEYVTNRESNQISDQTAILSQKVEIPGPNFLSDEDSVTSAVSDENKLCSTKISQSSSTHDSENTKGNQFSTNTHSKKAVNKFEKNNHVKTLIIGDDSFSNLLLGSNIMADDEYFKVAKPGATFMTLSTRLSISLTIYYLVQLMSLFRFVMLIRNLVNRRKSKKN